MQRLILRSFQSPGDIVMLTAAVRDLHQAAPGRFQTDVRTSTPALWENNPHVTRIQESEPGVRMLDMHYPLVHQSNQRPYHFLHGYVQYLEERLGMRIPVSRFSGDIHLTLAEKEAPPPGSTAGVPEHFWIIVAGGKQDFTAKWWEPDSYQAVVDHFHGRLTFVQCGEEGHWHPRLRNVVDLVGKTTTREFIRLMYHAAGVLCPVTFAMHLAAAVETKPGLPKHRPCVVVAGGREPPHWEAYPHHQFLSTTGALSCCAEGGCWKSRCQPVGDGDEKDRNNLCEQPVQVRPDLRIPRCMTLIAPADVCRRIELYYAGEALRFPGPQATAVRPQATHLPPVRPPAQQKATRNVLLRFRHGLGDAVKLTSVLAHLRHYHPDWAIDVAALVGKHSAFHGQCRRVFVLDRAGIDTAVYDRVFDLDWWECDTCYAGSPSTKAERCLVDVFHLRPLAELCRYTINRGPQADELAFQYLRKICPKGPGPDGRFPVVLLHYQGNTSRDSKDLPEDLARALCDDVLAGGMVPVVLDWDGRTSLANGQRVFCPDVKEPLWSNMGTGDAEVLAALIERAALMVGVDSGPLHVAAATTTPSLAVWLRHHPLHFFHPADNVTHLVPEDHLAHLRGDRAAGADFFTRHYRHQAYHDLAAELRAAVQTRIKPAQSRLSLRERALFRGAKDDDVPDGLVLLDGFWVRDDNAAQDLVIVHDVFADDCYLADAIPHPEPVVVDVGAHIGCFSKRLHDRLPRSRVVAVECCPENILALSKNIGPFATVVQAALTYEPEPALLNAVYPGCCSTGGSILLGRAELRRRQAAGEVAANPGPDMPSEYWADLRALRTLTLEQLMQEHGLDHIDVLKLDCEGSEFSILRATQSLDRIGLIVGEYHDRERFEELVRERFAGWELRILRDDDPGTFWLVNPVTARVPAAMAGQAGVNGFANGNAETRSSRLVVDGAASPLGADYTLRWVDQAEGPAKPALYHRGKRITRRWSLELSCQSAPDAHGGNANTE